VAHILILDDDFEQATAWRDALVMHGHTVDVCYSSSEAIVYARTTAYDIYIADLMMQSHAKNNDSGRFLLKYLRETKDLAEVGACAIGVSGLDTHNNAATAQMLFVAFGVYDFLPKPFTPNELVDLVNKKLAAKT